MPSLPSISAQRRIEPARLTRLVRGDLDWIVMKCLEKDRSRRYETAAGVAADLRRYLDDEPVLACPPSAVYSLPQARPAAPGAVVAAAAMALADGGGGRAAWRLSTSWIAYQQQRTASALEAETRAKELLRRDGYFHRIALAHRELAADDLPPASELLGECPEDLRATGSGITSSGSAGRIRLSSATRPRSIAWRSARTAVTSPRRAGTGPSRSGTAGRAGSIRTIERGSTAAMPPASRTTPTARTWPPSARMIGSRSGTRRPASRCSIARAVPTASSGTAYAAALPAPTADSSRQGRTVW